MRHPFAEYRHLFPILEHKVQLSSCSQSALSMPVRWAMDDYLASWSQRGADWGYWMQQVFLARAAFARLVNARAEDIAVLGSVSDAASAVVSALSFGAGQRRGIVCSTLDFPSLCHVWLAQQPRGARVQLVAAQAGVADAGERVARALDRDTALLAVSQACYYDGQLVDIAATGAAARAQGAVQFVDAYQSAGAVAIDVQAQQVDILAAGAQKYLLGTPGIAFLYVRPALAQGLEPAVTGWFGRREPFAFDPARLDFADGGARFSTGTPPMLCAAAARAGIELLNEVGVPAIQDYLAYLSEVALEEAARLRLEVASPADPLRKNSNTAVRVPDAAALEKPMFDAGYVVSARNDVLRIAPHFYNTADDVVGALRALAALVS